MSDFSFDEVVDVLVVGYGLAGGISAIEAHEAGAKVLLIEKMPFPGGISILSGGGVRCAEDADEAFTYLKTSNAGTTPDDVIRVLADGMTQARGYVEGMAARAGAKVQVGGLTADEGVSGGNYPFPGFRTFYNVRIEADEKINLRETYPRLRTTANSGGPYLFRVLEANVEQRGIEVRFNTSASRLIIDGDAGVVGIIAEGKQGSRRIGVRRGVVLACGGFEADEEMKRQYFQAKPVLTAATRGNTGDGIRMAQSAGAALWHMWHYHGSYAYRHSDPKVPFALRVKRIPDWNPIDNTTLKVPMVWIVVDKTGKRYMNECPPYAQDTSHRPMELFDPETQTFPRIPSFLICDEKGRTTYRLGDSRSNDPEFAYDWSNDNLKEIESGILTQCESIAGIAREIGAPAASLAQTIERWNALCAKGNDDDFGRPPGTMMPISQPPFIVARVWPTISNTQGGPVHNARQQIMNAFGEPVRRLYASGELGSSFGHLYLSGGNIAECVVTGRIAGTNAAAEPPRVA